MEGSVIQPNGAVSGENPFNNPTLIMDKSFVVSSITGLSDVISLTQSEINAMLASKALLLQMTYISANSNESLCDSKIALNFTYPTISGATANQIRLDYDSKLTETTKAMVGCILQVYSANGSQLYFSMSQAYRDDQYSSGHTWHFKMYKLA